MKFDADELYELANAFFPDEGPLAVFNLMFEMHNGRLACDDSEALRETEAEGAIIAGFYAFLDLGGGKTFHSCRSFTTGLDEKEVLDRLAEAVDGLPDEPEAEREVTQQLTKFPTCNAAMAAWRLPDGSVRQLLYRHPGLTAARASTILKSTVELIRDARAKSAQTSGKN